jgi:hypothetical protein
MRCSPSAAGGTDNNSFLISTARRQEDFMKQKLTIVALAAAILAARPDVARAQCSVDQVVADCDRVFPRESIFGTPFRGWCYLLGTATCAVG